MQSNLCKASVNVNVRQGMNLRQLTLQGPTCVYAHFQMQAKEPNLERKQSNLLHS